MLLTVYNRNAQGCISERARPRGAGGRPRAAGRGGERRGEKSERGTIINISGGNGISVPPLPLARGCSCWVSGAGAWTHG